MPIAQINGHDMYYEVHGDGPPAVYIGGWDTFCHGRHHISLITASRLSIAISKPSRTCALFSA